MRALETGNQTLIQEIVTKKQQLRDLTNIDFSDVTNSAQLKEKWPTEILGQIPF
jgi:phage shock protein A